MVLSSLYHYVSNKMVFKIIVDNLLILYRSFISIKEFEPFTRKKEHFASFGKVEE